MDKVVAIIQARMSSTRLPGKVMLVLNNDTVLYQVVSRVRKANVDDVIIATSNHSSDDAIVKFCQEQKISYYRGSLNNVLSRYYMAAKEYEADIVVRITSDCPLYDHTILNDMLSEFNNCDYLSNCFERTFPRGLDTEIFTFKSLEKTYNQAKRDQEKEHVTPYIWQNPHLFKLKNHISNNNLSNHRWTLDTKEDYQLIQSIYQNLGDDFTTKEVIEFLEKNPDIFSINQHIEQKQI
jgi:spore coat polysaccharide biosynthesis protein SpsF